MLFLFFYKYKQLKHSDTLAFLLASWQPAGNPACMCVWEWIRTAVMAFSCRSETGHGTENASNLPLQSISFSLPIHPQTFSGMSNPFLPSTSLRALATPALLQQCEAERVGKWKVDVLKTTLFYYAPWMCLDATCWVLVPVHFLMWQPVFLKVTLPEHM